MYKAVIFDVDGTLTDATEGIISSVDFTIKKHNLKELSAEILKTFVGPPIQDSLKAVYKMSDEQAQICANTFREKYKNGDVFKAQIYDGICILLNYLKNKGYKLGVATYKREDYAADLMHHLGLGKYFDVVCGADNENKLRKSDIISNCMDKLKCNTKECIMVGDSNHDMNAAELLDMDFIAVTYGFGFRKNDNLNSQVCIGVADSVDDILKIIIKKEN